VTPLFSRAIVVALAAHLASEIQAQPQPTVTVPAPALQTIALDFDQGRNPIYCYFGRVEQAVLSVHVDSVTTVASPSACHGIGLGFVTRIANAEFLMQAIRGLIEASPEFAVVSAYYRTEDIPMDGGVLRGARALSVLRGAPTLALSKRSGG